jgi:hypothetical protein
VLSLLSRTALLDICRKVIGQVDRISGKRVRAGAWGYRAESPITFQPPTRRDTGRGDLLSHYSYPPVGGIYPTVGGIYPTVGGIYPPVGGRLINSRATTGGQPRRRPHPTPGGQTIVPGRQL